MEPVQYTYCLTASTRFFSFSPSFLLSKLVTLMGSRVPWLLWCWRKFPAVTVHTMTLTPSKQKQEILTRSSNTCFSSLYMYVCLWVCTCVHCVFVFLCVFVCMCFGHVCVLPEWVRICLCECVKSMCVHVCVCMSVCVRVWSYDVVYKKWALVT